MLRGDSGSGKTTLADLLSGAIAPQKGQIISDGDIWFDAASGINRPPQERGIGFVFQTHRLFPNLTVEENIRFPVLFSNRKPLLAFDELINLLGIEKLLPRHPATLSGGESQRVKLATELSKRDTGKTLYILDEPTTGLHFEDIRVLMGVLNKLVDKGNTVIVIEHNLDVIKMADYIIDMGPEGGKGGGELLSYGTPEEVAKSPKGYTPKFLREELGL